MTKVFLSILFIGSFGFVKAQSRLSIALETGPNVSTVSTENKWIDFEPKLGHAIGVSLVYDIDATFSVRMGVGTQRKGASAEITFTDDQGGAISRSNVKFNQDYLVIPIYGRMKFGTTRNFYLTAGPYLGFLTRSTQKFTFTTVQNNDTRNFRKPDVGLSLGLGRQIPISPVFSFNIEGVYSHGLTSVNSVSDINWSNRSLALLFGVQYRFHSDNSYIETQ